MHADSEDSEQHRARFLVEDVFSWMCVVFLLCYVRIGSRISLHSKDHHCGDQDVRHFTLNGQRLVSGEPGIHRRET